MTTTQPPHPTSIAADLVEMICFGIGLDDPMVIRNAAFAWTGAGNPTTTEAQAGGLRATSARDAR